MPKRVDANQAEIVEALRDIGAGVAVTSDLGNGFADIVVGWQGNNWLFEIKDFSKPPSARRLTPAEKKFHDTWRVHGQIDVITSFDDALQYLTRYASPADVPPF